MVEYLLSITDNSNNIANYNSGPVIVPLKEKILWQQKRMVTCKKKHGKSKRSIMKVMEPQPIPEILRLYYVDAF